MFFKEAKIIIPASIEPLKYEVWFNKLWGGFTKQLAEGSWLSPTGTNYIEDVVIYTIAMKDTPGFNVNSQALVKIASIIAKENKQECVYIKNVNGVCSLVTGEGKIIPFGFEPGNNNDRSRALLLRDLLNG